MRDIVGLGPHTVGYNERGLWEYEDDQWIRLIQKKTHMYIKHAACNELKAQNARDESTKRSYLAIAASWWSLAELQNVE